MEIKEMIKMAMIAATKVIKKNHLEECSDWSNVCEIRNATYIILAIRMFRMIFLDITQHLELYELTKNDEIFSRYVKDAVGRTNDEMAKVYEHLKNISSACYDYAFDYRKGCLDKNVRDMYTSETLLMACLSDVQDANDTEYFEQYEQLCNEVVSIYENRVPDKNKKYASSIAVLHDKTELATVIAEAYGEYLVDSSVCAEKFHEACNTEHYIAGYAHRIAKPENFRINIRG